MLVPQGMTNVVGSLHSSGLIALVDATGLAALISAATDEDQLEGVIPLGSVARIEFLAPAHGLLVGRCTVGGGRRWPRSRRSTSAGAPGPLLSTEARSSTRGTTWSAAAPSPGRSGRIVGLSRGYSYWRASMTSIFEARRAGQMPARTPAIPATISTTMIPTTGMPSTRPVVLERLDRRDRDEQPDHGADDRADHRRDQRLVADHPADLRLRGADRAQHADLAGALVDRQHERVDDAEEADDHRQREQHVDQREQLVDPVLLLLLELLLVAGLSLREPVLEQLCRSGRGRVGVGARARSRSGRRSPGGRRNCSRRVSIGRATRRDQQLDPIADAADDADRHLVSGRGLQRRRRRRRRRRCPRPTCDSTIASSG